MQAHPHNQATSSALDMRSVGFAYPGERSDRVKLFDGFDFRIEHGQWVGVIGPSGCGKSTLAKLITGIEVPDEGEVCVLGQDPLEVRATRQLGVAFQDSSLVPWFTARRNIQLPAMGLEEGRLGGAVQTLASAFMIGHRLEALPQELSGGMRVRVSLARALIHGPSFVVLDEPFSSLDEITAIEIARYLVHWRHVSPCSLLLISHDLEAVARLADRCLCFPAHSDDRFSQIDLQQYDGPAERSPETIARIRLQLLAKYL